MNLGIAIQAAHERKDTVRRNELIRLALANGSSYRAIARLLKKNVSTVYAYLGEPVERPDPLTLPVSAFENDALQRVVANTERIFDAQPVRDWDETLVDSRSALAASHQPRQEVPFVGEIDAAKYEEALRDPNVQATLSAAQSDHEPGRVTIRWAKGMYGCPVAMREDRPTETERDLIALRLAELNGETSDYKTTAGGTREEYDKQACELLSLVFGEETSRG